MRKASSYITSGLLLVLVAVGGGVAVMIHVNNPAQESQGQPSTIGAAIVEESCVVKVGDLQQLVLFIRSLNAEGRVDSIYLYDAEGDPAGVAYASNEVHLTPGSVSVGVFVRTIRIRGQYRINRA